MTPKVSTRKEIWHVEISAHESLDYNGNLFDTMRKFEEAERSRLMAPKRRDNRKAAK